MKRIAITVAISIGLLVSCGSNAKPSKKDATRCKLIEHYRDRTEFDMLWYTKHCV